MRRLIRSVTLLGLVAAAAAAPAPASAATHGLRIGPWHRIADPGTSTVVTDGSRYVVTLLNKRGIDVHDSLRNSDRALALPPCIYPGGQPDLQPRFVLGAGLVAWQCTYPERAAVWVDDIRLGTRTLAGGLAGVWQNEIGTADGGTFTLASIGRHWVYLIRDGYHYTDDILAGLHDTRVIVRPAQHADEAVDPDAATGVVRLCSGIRRPPGDLDIGLLPFLPLQYEAPYGVLTRDSRTFTSTVGGLRRCAGAHAAPTVGWDVQLGGGLFSWGRPDRADVQSTVTGARASRHVPGSFVAAAHTRHALYVTVTPPGKPDGPRRYYRARIS
jgi:hypothetical protein